MALPGLILKRGLIYPGNFKPGYDPDHLASAANKGVGGAGATSISAVARGANFINLLAGDVQGTATSITAKMDGVIGPSGVFGGSSLITFPCTTVCPPIYTFAAIFRGTTIAPGNLYGLICTSNGTGGLSFFINSSNNAPAININGASNGDPGAAFATAAGIPYAAIGSCNLANTSAYKFNYGLLRLDNGSLITTTVNSSQGALGALTTAQAGNFNIGALAGFQFNGSISRVMAESTFLTIPQIEQWASDIWSYWNPTLNSQVGFDAELVKAASGGGGAIPARLSPFGSGI